MKTRIAKACLGLVGGCFFFSAPIAAEAALCGPTTYQNYPPFNTQLKVCTDATRTNCVSGNQVTPTNVVFNIFRYGCDGINCASGDDVWGQNDACDADADYCRLPVGSASTIPPNTREAYQFFLDSTNPANANGGTPPSEQYGSVQQFTWGEMWTCGSVLNTSFLASQPTRGIGNLFTKMPVEVDAPSSIAQQMLGTAQYTLTTNGNPPVPSNPNINGGSITLSFTPFTINVGTSTYNVEAVLYKCDRTPMVVNGQDNCLGNIDDTHGPVLSNCSQAPNNVINLSDITTSNNARPDTSENNAQNKGFRVDLKYTFLTRQCDQCTADGDCGDSACNDCVDGQVAGTTGKICSMSTNGTSCNDDTVCNGLETCENGICNTTTSAPNCADQHACHQDVCNPQTGCSPPDQIATVCPDDDFACTETACMEPGGCEQVPHDEACAASTGPCQRSVCKVGQGCVLEDLTGPACDDGDACTQTDTCQSGLCVGTNPVSCTGDDCNSSACNHSTGQCEASPLNEGGSCEGGGAFCDGFKTCSNGACVTGPPPNCDDGNACKTDSCPAGGGACVHDPVPGCCNSNDDCNDTDQCTVNERCEDHVCKSDPRDCDDHNICTGDSQGHESCDPQSGCVVQNNTNPCDDGSGCTLGDVCAGGSCQPGSGTPDCTAMNNACNQGQCHSFGSESYECVQMPINDGQECGRNCNNNTFTIEECNNGSCAPVSAVDCNDGHACTADACNTTDGCTHTGVGACCESDSDCQSADLCSTGTCNLGDNKCSFTQKNCNDSNPCTDDSCNAGSGACVNSFNGCPFIEAACPCNPNPPWKNHGQYVSCVAHQANIAMAAGYITGVQHGQIVSTAAQSTCGAKK